MQININAIELLQITVLIKENLFYVTDVTINVLYIQSLQNQKCK